MFRFFVNKKEDEHFLLDKETLLHLKVARVTKETFICIYNECFFECVLENNLAKIIRKIEQVHEFAQEVILAAAIIETKNWEWMIQKATELGVTKIIPITSQNVSKKIFDINEKIARWQKIVIAAAEQSFRNVYPLICQPMKFEEIINLKMANKFIAHEKANLEPPLFFPQNSLFLIGPEGGFTEQEVQTASDKGFDIISLGTRILRAETASLFVLARVKAN